MTDAQTSELYNLISQLRTHKRVLEKRIAELEARECRLLTEDELRKILPRSVLLDFSINVDDIIQRKFAEVNGLKVKE